MFQTLSVRGHAKRVGRRGRCDSGVSLALMTMRGRLDISAPYLHRCGDSMTSFTGVKRSFSREISGNSSWRM